VAKCVFNHFGEYEKILINLNGQVLAVDGDCLLIRRNIDETGVYKNIYAY
jgi:hypothetical protein